MRRSTANPLVIAAAPVAVVLCAMLASVSLCVGFPCVTTGLRYGMWPDECPATDLRLDVTASAQGLLRRQDGGVVQIVPQARWLSGDDRDAYEQSSVLLRGMSWTVTLQDEHGEAVPGLELGRARRSAGLWIPAKLPDIPDGDYVLHVEVDAGFESATVDVPVPVYAPAVVHAMTDRPLYKPGQDVLLRSVALRRSDLRPLAGRPGKWQILDPEGNEMLLERDRASDWGVADGSFPLDTSSAIGTWTARWVTGDAVDTVPFEVRPFRLPRFVVDAAPDRRWYRIGDAVVIEGRAVYTSGAPVADAPVEVQLAATEGRWPLPLDWEEVHTARTSADGRYRVTIGAVPPDLMDRTVAAARVAVTDKTGEVAQGAGTVVLSDRSLRLETMTELGGGLVAGFNNRMYLRVSTPDGTPLPDAELLIRRPYDPTDPGKPATTDVDGVATVQLDPGAPVTVVEPAPPVRVRPVHAPPPSLSSAREATTGSLDLEERRAFDAVIPAVAPCSTFAIGDRSVSVGVQVGASGAVRKTVADDDPLSACVARAMGRLSMPAGGERTYAVEWGIPDAQLPSIAWAPTTVFQLGGSSVDGLVGDAGVAARACLGPGQGIDGAEVVVVHWAVDRGATAVTTVVDERPGHGLPPSAIGCLKSALGGLKLDVPADGPAMGAAVGRLTVPRPAGFVAPQPIARTAYELAVTATSGADSGSELLGEGRVIVDPGAIPPLRLRAEPSLAAPGSEVAVELIRGPGFFGELPEELLLFEGTALVARAKVTDKVATFTIPADRSGFLHTEWNGARAVVFVRDAQPLSVEVRSDRPTYRPRETATLTVSTRAGADPVAAAVGLAGVDATLAQLATLVGPNDFGRVTVRTTATTPAFGAFDPKALVLGQIRGENAARAAVLAIDGLPMDAAGDAPSSGSAQHRADTEDRLRTNFYRALDRVTVRVRDWEAAAAPGALLEPTAMVDAWNGALADLDAAGDPAVDGYGRELTLDVLPPDLLVLTDPRQIVSDGARLPEDFVGWVQFVEQEVIR